MGRPRKTDQDVELPTFEPKPDGDCWQCPTCKNWVLKVDDWEYTCTHCGAVSTDKNDVVISVIREGPHGPYRVTYSVNAVVRFFVDAHGLAQKRPGQ